MNKPLSQTWDLESLFPGGSESAELDRFITALEGDITAFRAAVDGLTVPATAAEVGPLAALLVTFQELASRLRQAGAFIGCLNAQNMKDEKAKLLGGRASAVSAAYSSASTMLDTKLLQVGEAAWAGLIASPELKGVSFPLEERRSRAKAKMGPELESLVNDLNIDGYHAWGELYNTVVSRITIPFEENGKSAALSVGQAANKMSSADRAVREQVFANWEEAWAGQAELCAAALNHLAGYRINLYKHRGWESILQEPLENNRMSEATLNVMWDVIDRNKHHLVAYMERKAKLLAIPKLSWHDVDAPLSRSTKSVTYDEAADFIVEQFGRFNPEMASFAKMAFEQRWIEAEDRPGKRPGGFCTSLPLSQQSRIFMTFGGTASNVATLAHELGHAYHGWVMKGLPQLARNYSMNVAETASTFAEMIVADAALKAAESHEERLALLADKVERSVAFFMNIHARFIFETRFYEERKKGLISVARLNQLMEEAQREAYCDGLSEYHPHFWASKLHFYSTGQPFYNYPYTFGYLFSAGVYARALAEGPTFAAKYDDLLRDTGSMRVEELAMRHLGVDLTQPEFWQSAVDLAVADIDEFLALTK